MNKVPMSVLLIDDGEAAVESLIRSLRKWAIEYPSRTARDGAAGLKHYRDWGALGAIPGH